MSNDIFPTRLVPRLVVKGVDNAIDHYKQVFGAELIERIQDDSGIVVHAEMAIGESSFTMTEEVRDWKLLSASETASPVLLRLTLPDPDRAAEKLIAGGGCEIISIEDRPYGYREGRIQDAFGHLWILSRPLTVKSAN